MSSIDDISAKITLDSSGYTAGMNSVNASTQKATQSMAESLKSIGEVLDVSVTVPLTALGYKAVEAFNKATTASTVLSAEIRSTGDSSGYTANQLNQMATNLAATSQFGQTDILSGVIDSLQKFRYISGDTFQNAAKDAVGYAAASGISLSEASNTIGRALENPIMAFRLLRGTMADLSPEQQKQINMAMAMGKIQDAQNIIIGNLNRGYGDQAAKMAALPSAKIAKDMSTINESLEPMGGIIEKTLVPFFDIVAKIGTAFKNASPEIQAFITVSLGIAAAVGPVLTFFGFMGATILPALTSGFALVTAAVNSMIAGFMELVGSVAPWLIAAAAVIYTAQVIYDNWKSIVAEGKLVADTFLYVKNTLQGWTAASAQNRADMQKDNAAMISSTVDFKVSYTNLISEIKSGAVTAQTALAKFFGFAEQGYKEVGNANKKTASDLTPPWITALDNMETAAQVGAKAMETAMESMAEAITNALTTGANDWNQIIGTVLQAMLKTMVDWGIKSLGIEKLVAQGMVDLGALAPFVAVGAIIALMAIISSMHMAPAMAKGGMFDSATTVTVGEAGPEVILPVTRLSNGKMGVEAQSMVGGGSGGVSPKSPESQGSSGNDMIQVEVMLDSRPILKAVSRASRTGKIVIHPNSVRVVSVNT